jgi:sensor histidine kinase YesM
VDPRTGLEGAENLVPTRIQSPDRPARSESLYRLSYPGPHIYIYMYIYNYLQLIEILTFWYAALNTNVRYFDVVGLRDQMMAIAGGSVVTGKV